ncbi:hypothetical protein E2C01_083545 [Portunus trituberculatus]|uniref:Uncharacterized protein n=1 Tax=Portunus trituberculatus TaxID=210409 RepID=A0A5B7J228_PORTR|nr:hypothetical protein [Portunus trituberculatus]
MTRREREESPEALPPAAFSLLRNICSTTASKHNLDASQWESFEDVRGFQYSGSAVGDSLSEGDAEGDAACVPTLCCVLTLSVSGWRGLVSQDDVSALQEGNFA